MAKISDVSKLANVSTATVSRVLNNNDNVREETRKRVEDAIKQLNYRPNTSAQNLVKNKTDTIGVIVSDITDPFFSKIIHGIEDVAHKFNYGIVYACMHWDSNIKHSHVEFLYNGRTDGLIMMGDTIGDESYARDMVKSGFPLVLIEHKIDELKANLISIDNIGGGYTATKHLLELGHRRIAHLAGNKKAHVSEERLTGYRKALAEYAVPYSEDLVAYSDFTTENSIPVAKQLLSLPDRPTAIFAASDLMAYGVIHAARELGIKVPQELAVVGYDDIELASMITPPLTTIRQARYEIGSMAAWALIQQIENKTEPTVTEVKTSLVIRESCGANLNKKSLEKTIRKEEETALY